MPACAVKLCKNNTTKNKKDAGITYHLFPVDPVICDRWTDVVRLSREESWWKPGKRCVICSAHFSDSDFYLTKCGLKRLRKGAVPKNALFLTPIDSMVTVELTEPEPSTTVVDKTITATGTITPPLEGFSDINSMFNSSKEIKLKEKLQRKAVLQAKHARTIKTLREKVSRMKKTICSLRKISKSSKQKRLIAE